MCGSVVGGGGLLVKLYSMPLLLDVSADVATRSLHRHACCCRVLRPHRRPGPRVGNFTAREVGRGLSEKLATAPSTGKGNVCLD